MCTKARAYLTLLREYKAEIVMIVGFVAEINLRLSNLEQQSRK